ncbi:MAG TPA: hypothetical protein VJ183_07185 [Chloroflexia bacterium]|nr:hypothetical protein [Chloroflexia bacterium]
MRYIKRPFLDIIGCAILIATFLPASAPRTSIAEARLSAPATQGDSRTFPETHQTIAGDFLKYWNEHGALAQQGYPISPEMQELSEIDGKSYTVQYFERAKFEKHPEQPDPQNQVLLELFGVLEYRDRYPLAAYLQGAPNQAADTTPGSVLFELTGKRLGGTFLRYWQTHGDVRQQGYPITDVFEEVAEDGKTYKVQYFERAKFELHAEFAGTANEVLLSRIGAKFLEKRFVKGGDGSFTPKPTAIPTPITRATETPVPGEKVGEVLDTLLYKFALSSEYSISENVTVKGQVYSKVLVYKSGRIDGVFMDGEWKRGIPQKANDDRWVFIDGQTDVDILREVTKNPQGMADSVLQSFAIQLSDSSRPSPDDPPTLSVEAAISQIKSNSYLIRAFLPIASGAGGFALKQTDINLRAIYYVFLDSRNYSDLDSIIPYNAKFGGQDSSLRFAIFADTKGELYYVKISPREVNPAQVGSQWIYAKDAFVLTNIPSFLNRFFVDDPNDTLYSRVALGSGQNPPENVNLDKRIFLPNGLIDPIFQAEQVVK